jgi:hypothetical protein
LAPCPRNYQQLVHLSVWDLAAKIKNPECRLNQHLLPGYARADIDNTKQQNGLKINLTLGLSRP